MCYKRLMLVDSHCHLEMESFDKDRAEVIARSLGEGLIYMLTVGTEAKYFPTVLQIIEDYPEIYGALGVHPHNSAQYPEMAGYLKDHLKHEKVVALGEIGLDFFRNYAPRDTQFQAFREQIALATEMRLPIIIHSRNAKEDTLGLLEEHRGRLPGGVVHCFSYDLDAARRLLDLGLAISIPGTVTYSNAGKLAEVVRYVPLESLLSETDAPWLTPVPKRGKRNEPYFVKYTVEKIASIRGIAPESAATALCDNFRNIFLR